MEAKLRLKRKMDVRRGAEAAARGGKGGRADGEGSDAAVPESARAFKRARRVRVKERTLVFCTRGVTSRFRHLMEDIRSLLPHHKKEVKVGHSASLRRPPPGRAADAPRAARSWTSRAR